MNDLDLLRSFLSGVKARSAQRRLEQLHFQDLLNQSVYGRSDVVRPIDAGGIVTACGP